MSTLTPISIMYKNKVFSLIIYLLTLGLSHQVLAADRTIWESRNDYVALDSGDIRVNTKNDHPADLSPQNVFTILKSIRYTEKSSLFNFDSFLGDDDDDVDNFSDRLFSDSSLRKLSPAIAKALTAASNSQDVIFSITGPHQAAIGSQQLTTTGRVFLQDGNLNLIFGNVYVDIAKKYRRQGNTSDVPAKVDYTDLKFFKLPVGSRTKEHDMSVDILKLDGISFENKRTDWLVLNTKMLIAQADKEKATRNTNTPSQTVDTDVVENQKQLENKVERLERLMEARDKTSTSDSPLPASNVSPSDMESRLQTLKKLYDKGILTEEVYESKMQQILNDL